VGHNVCDIDTFKLSNAVVSIDAEELGSLCKLDGLDTIRHLAAVHRDDIPLVSHYYTELLLALTLMYLSFSTLIMDRK